MGGRGALRLCSPCAFASSPSVAAATAPVGLRAKPALRLCSPGVFAFSVGGRGLFVADRSALARSRRPRAGFCKRLSFQLPHPPDWEGAGDQAVDRVEAARVKPTTGGRGVHPFRSTGSTIPVGARRRARSRGGGDGGRDAGLRVPLRLLRAPVRKAGLLAAHDGVLPWVRPSRLGAAAVGVRHERGRAADVVVELVVRELQRVVVFGLRLEVEGRPLAPMLARASRGGIRCARHWCW